MSNPYAAPVSDPGPIRSEDARREGVPRIAGDDVVAFIDVALPPICLKCGATSQVRGHRHRLPATGGRWAALAGAVLGGGIARPMDSSSVNAVDVMFATAIFLGWVAWAFNRRRSIVADVPLCAKCETRWRRGVTTWAVFVVAFHALALLGVATGQLGLADFGLLVLAALVVLTVVAFVVDLPTRFVAVRVRRENVAVLARVDRRARDELVRWGDAHPEAPRPV